jgi:hypothetical protein
MRDEDESREGFDTSPPPDGAEDPYAAPTKVARVPDQLLHELLKLRSETTDAPLPEEITATEPARNDAAANDLSDLAAAASHAVAPRPGIAAKHPLSPGTKPSAFGPPAVAALPAAALMSPAAAAPSAIDPMLPVNASEPEAHVPFGLDDPGFGESPSSPGTGPAGAPQQSGRTVPLSAALLASVIKSVDDKRATAVVPAPAVSEAAVPKRRSLFTLGLILALGLGVFVTGILMFLDALK